jgi:hypothetical protein
MKQLGSTRNFVAIIVMALLMSLAASATAFGTDRHDRGRNRGNRDNSNWSKRNRKCGKFVNCHDARNGRWRRWDERGPRGQRVGNVVWRNRIGNRNFNNSRLWRQRRARLIIRN